MRRIHAYRLLNLIVAVVLLASFAVTPLGAQSPQPPSAVTTQENESFRQSIAANTGFLTYPFPNVPGMQVQWDWVDKGHNGIDYINVTEHGSPWRSFDVLAAAGGNACVIPKLTLTCPNLRNPTGPYVKIYHQFNGQNYLTEYNHLRSAEGFLPTCPRTIPVRRGERIGVAGDRNLCHCTPPCIHLHFGLYHNGVAINPNDYWASGLSRYSCPLPPKAPYPFDPRFNQGVTFYLHTDYDSGGEGGEGIGCISVPASDGYSTSVPFTLAKYFYGFGASSVQIPLGYYIDLREMGGNGFARMYCEDKADNASFVDNRFFSVGNWPPPVFRSPDVNDRVGGVTVHSGSCGQPPGLGGGGGGGGMNSTASASACPANNPPLAPSLQSPSNGYVATNYRAPTLCWNNNGDPDGDQTYFYAEVYNSPINANSGWINGTCWRPGQLDYQYHTYQWRVKARDARGADSGWSETWSFRVAPPNYPPSISFDSANGNTFPSGSIDTRESNWTFRGAASDPEGQLSRVEWRCSGDNCGWQAGHTNGTSWSHTRNGMSGQNDVYFVAYDNVGNYTFSRHLDLRIDQAAPATQSSLNNEANPAYWPTWFASPVQVRLYAVDGNTGRARVGVREVRYQLDGGAWQTQGGDTVNFTVSSDGAHSVAFYAVDHLDNTEGVRTVNFQIDQTPPNPPGGVVETNGVLNNQWQKAHNTPTFTWAASADATSGVWGYQFYFGEDSNGQGYQTFTAADPRQWTPQPGGVHTGVYYLRGRARDNAGNWSAWTTAFIYRYDGTPPENPSAVTHTAGITSTVWQRITNAADFSWLVPYDEGSGIKGYYGYWGTDPNGVSTNLLTTNRFQDPAPLCDLNGACTGYLRLRSVDNVDNLANEWSTAFVLRYDNVPPTVDFTFNRGVTQTGQTQVTLNIIASDEGSGVRAMRFSTDGQNWTPWEVYADERPWIVPPISRQAWPVYVQVQDEVGLTSAVISHTVYLDVNLQAPRSANFWLFDNTISAGTGGYTSTTHTGRGTLGQVLDSPAVTSTHFVLWNGYEVGSQAVPIMEPAHEDYDFVNGIFASGNVATTMTSTLYVMIGTYGEVGLSNDTTITSASFQHQPGFLAAEPWIEPAPVLEPGPAPQPEPPLACKTPQIRINGDTAFTNDVRVTLSICAPGAVEMMIGSSETLTDTVWEPYAELKIWMLLVPGQFVQPAFVYAAFKDADGTVHGTYFDDVIYDPNQPSGSLMVGDSIPGGSYLLMSSGASEVQVTAASAATFRVGNVAYARQVGGAMLEEPLPVLPANPDGSINIFVDGYDDNSGISEMQFSGSDDFTGIAWEPFAAVMQWTPPGEEDGVKTVFARVHDNAGNLSAVSSVDFVFDSQPPLGGLAFTQRVAGVEAVTATVYFGAEDNCSGVTDLRFGHTPDLADAAWQSYTDTMVVPISPTLSSPETLYAQYRDLAGNVSDIYSDTLVVDTVPPVVYVDVEVGEALAGTGTITMPTTFTRTVTVAAYDELSDVTLMYLSNDPLMIDGVATLPYTETVSWVFDERRVVWAQAEDSVGNVSDPYPAYAREAPPLPNKVYLPLIVK